LSEKAEGKWEAVNVQFVGISNEPVRESKRPPMYDDTHYDEPPPMRKRTRTGPQDGFRNDHVRNDGFRNDNVRNDRNDNVRNDHIRDIRRPLAGLREGMQYRGIVKSYNEHKKFGFIVCNESDEDVMFREEELAPGYGKIRKGDDVSFVVRLTPKGSQATNVALIGAQEEESQGDHQAQGDVVTEIKLALQQLTSNQLSDVLSYSSSLLRDMIRV